MKLSALLRIAAIAAVISGTYALYNTIDVAYASNATNTQKSPAKSAPVISQTIAPQPKTAIDIAVADPIVARIDNEEIRQSDVKSQIAKLDMEIQKLPPQNLFPLLIDRMINTKLVAEAAQAKNIEATPEFQARLADLKEQALIETLVDKRIKEVVTAEALRTAYNDFLKDNPPEDEVKASHILVKTEAEANEIVKKLKAGADFTTLAKEVSLDPTVKTNGGDLGYFVQKVMPENFGKAVFNATPVSIIDKPIETDLGWHVIKVEDRRKATLPTYTQMEGELRRQLSQKAVDDLIKELRTGKRIEVMQWDGSLAAAKPATPSVGTAPQPVVGTQQPTAPTVATKTGK